MECYYHYETIGGYVQMSVYDSLDDLIASRDADEDGDIETLIYDHEFINIAKAILSHAFAGDTAFVEKCAQDFINSNITSNNHTLTLHQIEDWAANWKIINCKPKWLGI